MNLPMNLDRWFWLTLAVLATWRITHLLALEDGPWDMIVAIRRWLGTSFLGRLMDCFYCLSVWVAAPIACLLVHKWIEWPLYWLALSGAACLLERPSNHPFEMQPVPPNEETNDRQD